MSGITKADPSPHLPQGTPIVGTLMLAGEEEGLKLPMNLLIKNQGLYFFDVPEESPASIWTSMHHENSPFVRTVHYIRAFIATGCIIPITATFCSVYKIIEYVSRTLYCKFQAFKIRNLAQVPRVKTMALIDSQIATLRVKKRLLFLFKCMIPFFGEPWAVRTSPFDDVFFGDLPKRYNELALQMPPNNGTPIKRTLP